MAVAQEEWSRLAGDSLDIDRHVYVARSVEKSLRAFQSLQLGGMPDYNEWDALLYGTWFQPKQINIVSSILWTLRRQWNVNSQPWWNGDILDVPNGNVHVIDFGCGALATQFAIALAALDSIGRGVRISSIRIDSIDTSLPMIYFGQRVWDRFVGIMHLRYPHEVLSSVLNLVQGATHTGLDQLPNRTDSTCYLTSIHAAYEQALDEVKIKLSKLMSMYDPDGLLLTTQSGKWLMLHAMCPATGNSDYLEIPVQKLSMAPVFSGPLSRVTEWRRMMLARLLVERDVLINAGVDINFLRNYLTSDVEWQYSPLASRVHMKREIKRTEFDDLPW